MPRIPLIEDLTTGPIPARSNLLVEFDAASQWYNMSVTMASGWLRQGGTVSYNLTMQSPERLRSRFERLGLKPSELEKKDKLRVQDYFTATLGKTSGETHAWNSLKVQDLSVEFGKYLRPRYDAQVAIGDRDPEFDLLRIWDNLSVLGRFNEDKAWVEFVLSRGLPLGMSLGATTIHAIVTGVHEQWVYRRLRLTRRSH